MSLVGSDKGDAELLVIYYPRFYASELTSDSIQTGFGVLIISSRAIDREVDVNIKGYRPASDVIFTLLTPTPVNMPPKTSGKAVPKSSKTCQSRRQGRQEEEERILRHLHLQGVEAGAP